MRKGILEMHQIMNRVASRGAKELQAPATNQPIVDAYRITILADMIFTSEQGRAR